jgi:antirestriction protein ArdC
MTDDTEAATVVTSAERHAHIIELCSNNAISYERCARPSQAWAANKWRHICIPQIRSPISYSTALHEIGHILGKHQRRRDSMLRERAAWQWAKSNALMWTPAMERHADKCLMIIALKLRNAVT